MTVDPETIRDLTAEEQALGAMLLGGSGAREIAAAVDPADWHRGLHRTVHESVLRLLDDGRGVGPLEVLDELTSRGQGPDDGGVALVEVAGRTSHSASGLHWAAKVAAVARRRRAAQEAHALAAAAADPAVDFDTALHEHLDRIAAQRPGVSVVRPADLADDVARLHREGRASRGVTTGWPSVDAIWRPTRGTLTLVTGSPSSGKTALLDALIVNTASLHDWRWAVWSAESGGHVEHTARLAQVLAGQRFESLAAERIPEIVEDVDEYVTLLDPDELRTVGAILAQVRAEHARRPLNAVVIDPWTKLDPRADTRAQREDEWINAETGRLARFAARHDLLVVVAVHPRQVERTGGLLPVITPQLLSGGSMWARNADHIISVWRDDTAMKRDESLVDLHVQKIKRNGIDGRMGRFTTLRFDSSCGLYHDDAERSATGYTHWADREVP